MPTIDIPEPLAERIRSEAAGTAVFRGCGVIRAVADLLPPPPNRLQLLANEDGWVMLANGAVQWSYGRMYVAINKMPDRDLYAVAFGDGDTGSTFYRTSANVSMRLARNLRMALEVS